VEWGKCSLDISSTLAYPFIIILHLGYKTRLACLAAQERVESKPSIHAPVKLPASHRFFSEANRRTCPYNPVFECGERGGGKL